MALDTRGNGDQQDPLTPMQGLTGAEAARLTAEGKSNRTSAEAGKTPLQIVASNVFTLFNLLNLLLAVAMLYIRSYRNMLFIFVVIINTGIGIVQELRARRTIRRLKVLNAPQTAVIRDGREITCPSEELVLGDLVILRAGDQLAADCVVRDGTGAVNESLLTGESDDVSKKAGDSLLSGSYLTEGRLIAQVTRVGDDSYANRLTAEAHKVKRPVSMLLRDVRRIIRIDSLAVIPLGLLQFFKQYSLRHMPIETAVSSATAAMLGMIPEGLVLLTSVALTVGVIRLAQRQTLVQELYGIETLARTDIICLDKTGTLTTGEMEEADCFAEGGEKALRGSLSRFLGAFECKGATLTALGAWCAPGPEQALQLLPFSSKRKLSAARFEDGTLILGAPERVMAELPVQAHVWQQACVRRGLRVLALASASGEWSGETLPEQRSLIGLIALRDRIRPNAAETIRYFDRQGVTLKIISGDNPQTVSAVARQVQLPNADQWVDASALTDDELRENCDRYTVFGRVTPAQKKLLVKALQHKGHTVAMTGDGVNDIPALKTADCSIAMPGGADAAKHAAQLTLLNADFGSMPVVVDEGRRVVSNVTRTATLFLMKTLYSFGLAVLLLALPAAYPFQPIQMSLISACTIGIPSFFLALEPNHEPIREHFLRTVLTRALPGAISVILCASTAMLLEHLGWGHEACSTIAALSTGAIGLMELTLVCRPFTRLRTAVLLGMVVLFVLAVWLAGPIFFLIPLSAGQVPVLAGLIAAGAVILTVAERLIRSYKNK